MLKELEKCEICPHKCRVNRNKEIIGRCKSKNTIKLAKVSIHDLKNHVLVGKMVLEQYFF